MPADPPSALSPAPPPDAARLFFTFLNVGLSGFGGVLPFARRALVERRAWLTADAFNETLSLCQSLPGPNIVNLAVATGSRFAGALGAVCAVSGLIGAPAVIVIGLGALYDRFGGLPRAHGAILGLGAAAAGLVAATAVKMAAPVLRRRPVHGGAVMAVVFAAVGVARLPLPWVLAVIAPISIAAAWRRP